MLQFRLVFEKNSCTLKELGLWPNFTYFKAFKRAKIIHILLMLVRDCRQVLFQNKLFGYFQNETWRCVNKKCSATVSVEFATEIIIDVSHVEHIGLVDKSLC